MTSFAYAKEFDGYFIPADPDKHPKALAELFCRMMADEQAVFFNTVQCLSSEWPNDAAFQWRAMEKHVTPETRQMFKDMYDHTDRKP